MGNYFKGITGNSLNNDDYYKNVPYAFYFKLSIIGNNNKSDTSFQEVSGLTVDTELTEIREGGENRFSYRLPTRKRYQNLVLKRAILDLDSTLSTWCKDTLEGTGSVKIQPKTINVSLMDSAAKPLMVWNIVNAYPVKWEVGNFNAQENKIVIETLELAFLLSLIHI